MVATTTAPLRTKSLLFIRYSPFNYATLVDCDRNNRSSKKASRNTVKALLRNKAAIAAPTRMSGQIESKLLTPTAAINTEILAMMSLREQSQVERIFRSSER